MAVYAVKSGATGAADGSSWTDAFTTFAAAVTAAAADTDATIYVSNNHGESPTGTTYIFNDSGNTRVYVCVDSVWPPTAVAIANITTASGRILHTGTTQTELRNGVYIYGLAMQCGSGGSGGGGVRFHNTTTDARQVFEECTFHLENTSGNANNKVFLGSITAGAVGADWRLINCRVKFGNATAGYFACGRGAVTFMGGSLDPTGAAPTSGLFQPTSVVVTPTIVVDGFDFSGMSTTGPMTSNLKSGLRFTARNCKLVAAWTGSLIDGTPGRGVVAQLFNCDSGDTNYRYVRQMFGGSVTHETTVVRTAGASDGTTPQSLRMVSTGDVAFPLAALQSPPLAVWNETTGAARTVSVEVITDNVTLTDKEAWIEVQYLGTSGVPLALFASDRAADPLATAVNQTTSVEAWTTTGLTTPVKQALSVTITPQEKGWIEVVVHLAKASTTMYACPKIVVT